MARITLEDLNEMSDEVLDEEEEPMDGEEQNRLFAHWETVASTHQVSLPQGNNVYFRSGRDAHTFKKETVHLCLGPSPDVSSLHLACVLFHTSGGLSILVLFFLP